MLNLADTIPTDSGNLEHCTEQKKKIIVIDR